MSERSTLLGIYLNDHLAGATGGLALFRRATSSAQGASKAELAELTQQVTQDRQSLLALMHRLGVPVRHYKVAAGWALEKAGWLKTNGRLLHRSPLSDLVELEALVLGVQGKAAGFRACAASPSTTRGWTSPTWTASSTGRSARPRSWRNCACTPRPAP